MLWYLANGSLNDYLKSQVLLQGNYYTGQVAQLAKAEFSSNTGASQFDGFSLANLDNAKQANVLSVDKISAQLAPVAMSQLNSGSVGQKNTTIVHVETLTLSHLQVWREKVNQGNNLAILLERITMQLAKDYPALYPEISAKNYAKAHPEQNEQLALQKLANQEKVLETNQAVIASKKEKQKKRLLGKAQIRVIISSIVIEKLTFNDINKETNQEFSNVELGSLGGELGLDSNQLGGELLRVILTDLTEDKLEK